MPTGNTTNDLLLTRLLRHDLHHRQLGVAAVPSGTALTGTQPDALYGDATQTAGMVLPSLPW